MKKVIIAFSALLVIFLTACTSGKEYENTPEEFTASVESAVTTGISKETTSSFESNEPENIDSFSSDSSKNEISQEPKYAESVAEIPENAAYRQNEYYNYTDGFSASNVYFYDSHDNLILKLLDPYTDGDQPRRWEYSYEYNSDGTVHVMTSANSYGNNYQTDYEYNSDGTLAKEINYTNGKLYSTYVHIYDGHSEPVHTEHTYARQSNYNSAQDFEYEYDNSENILTKKVSSDTISYATTETYTYDKNGNMLSKSVNYDDVTYYTYDSDNRIITEEHYYEEKLKYTIEYDYDVY